MDQSKVKDEVREFVLKEFLPGEDPAALQDETPLISSGVLDSISTARMVSFLEGQYGIRFKSHEVNADHLDSVSRIVETVAKKR